MNKRRGDENARTKVTGAEEEGRGDAEAGEFFGDDWKGTCWRGKSVLSVVMVLQERRERVAIPSELWAKTTKRAMTWRPRLYSSSFKRPAPQTSDDLVVRTLSKVGGL